jgi:membrane protein YqaA with SNARE-associated domain
MLRRLYDWVMGLAASRHAQIALFVVAFAESSFFPIPPDVMLAPMVLARRDRAWRYAAICTAASVVGGMLGYAIGYYLRDAAQQLMSLTGHPEGKAQFQCWFDKFGLWVILIKGLTPIPYKLVTIASGLAQFSFPVFVAASIATRGLRFFLVAWVVRRFGPAMMPVIERRLAWFAGGLILLVVIGLVASHYLGGGGGTC